MTLIVETGAGLANAESYASVAFATAFHGARGKADAWDAVEDKEAALRNATDYMTQQYSCRWAGTRFSEAQALDWPRYDVPWSDQALGVRPQNVIPSELMSACAELALKSASAALLTDLGRETLSEKVDVISVTYAQGASRQTKYPTVEGWIRPLLKAGSGIPIVRV